MRLCVTQWKLHQRELVSCAYMVQGQSLSQPQPSLLCHFPAKCVPVLLHGDGLGDELLLHSKGSGTDITTGTVTQVSLPHIRNVLINLVSTRSVLTTLMIRRDE